ncbi:segregation/condensation protein A [uncultured Desulfuromonas sp.]|uniref:segregation and condensation protein A n=1 Tax=uncultured Desulfuromonas sp. TaxID=181013 RepID=UPI002621ABDD|nr:segregation/condensation protein A [uncultured Desulfuromonas sp.]
MGYQFKIDNFEGPLDLLLHLIRKNEMDISDIPIAEITVQYLAILEGMKSLNLEVAGEFLLMAATLMHIKSRMLLPASADEDTDDFEEDPRAELVRRLLEYQRFREAAASLEELPRLGREVFTRTLSPTETKEREEQEEQSLQAVGLFELVEAFRSLLKGAPEPGVHEVEPESLSVSERVNSILGLLSQRPNLAFSEIFSQAPGRQEVVVTFLAMLELVRLRLVHFMQNSLRGPILLFPSESAVAVGDLGIAESSLGYG